MTPLVVDYARRANWQLTRRLVDSSVCQVLHCLFSTNFRLNFPYFYKVSDFFAQCRWCTGGSEAWRFCVKLMLLIPAVLLPITIVCIALSHFQTTAKVSEPQTFPIYGMQEQDEQKIKDDISWCKFYGREYMIVVQTPKQN